MKHLMKGIRIAAYIAEIIVAGVNVNLPQVKLIQAM
mgnify:CR=1 FL=1